MRPLPGLLVLLCLTALSARAAEHTAVVVAGKALPAGTVLTWEQLSERLLPSPLASESMVTPKDAQFVVNQRLLEPLDAGEPLQWRQMATQFNRPSQFRPYCEWVKAAAKGRRAYPQASQVMDMRPVLTAARDLPAGTVLTRDMLVSRQVPGPFVSAYQVLESATGAVVGQRLLAALAAGDPLRYPELAVYASEPRCDWLFEQAGNLYEEKGPPEANTLPCPAGTKRVQGVPAGPEWTNLLPGWVAYCQKPDGARHGPLKAWHRLGKGLVEQGQYAEGLRTGPWKHWEPGQAQPFIEVSYSKGRPHGRWVSRSGGTPSAEGNFQDGLREGPWKLSVTSEQLEVQATFSAGLPQGTWRWLKADGSVARQLDFDKGLPKKAHPDTQAIAVAARELPPGTLVKPAMLKKLQLPKPFGTGVFIGEDGVSYVFNQRMGYGIPAGAPLLWLDLDAPHELPAPAPAPKGGR